MIVGFWGSGVCCPVLSIVGSVKGNIRSSNALVVGANGTPLDVMGKITLSVRLGSVLDEHEFIVVKELTVECLLGADYMEKNVLIDFRRKCLKLGSNDVEVSFIDSNSSGNNRMEDSLVTASQTVQIPANSVLLLNAKVKGDFGEFGEGLIEDGKMEGKPSNVLVARSLCVLNDKSVLWKWNLVHNTYIHSCTSTLVRTLTMKNIEQIYTHTHTCHCM